MKYFNKKINSRWKCNRKKKKKRPTWPTLDERFYLYFFYFQTSLSFPSIIKTSSNLNSTISSLTAFFYSCLMVTFKRWVKVFTWVTHLFYVENKIKIKNNTMKKRNKKPKQNTHLNFILVTTVVVVILN